MSFLSTRDICSPFIFCLLGFLVLGVFLFWFDFWWGFYVVGLLVGFFGFFVLERTRGTISAGSDL